MKRKVSILVGILVAGAIIFNKYIDNPSILSPASTISTENNQAADEQPITDTSYTVENNTLYFNNNEYPIIEVDGGDLSGSRQKSVAVDIGYGDRTYWGLTNQYGQLVYVFADEVILQDDQTEDVNSNGRYYNDEAAVPGTEKKEYDQGHVIADSLGGVSNAYNITPQDATLNRHGEQAYMEKEIREAGGCQKLFATITYPDTSTMTPSSYHFKYILKGQEIEDDFLNQSPERE